MRLHDLNKRQQSKLPRGIHPAYLELDDDSRVLNDLDELVATFVYVQIRREKDKRHRGSGAGAAVAAA